MAERSVAEAAVEAAVELLEEQGYTNAVELQEDWEMADFAEVGVPMRIKLGLDHYFATNPDLTQTAQVVSVGAVEPSGESLQERARPLTSATKV